MDLHLLKRYISEGDVQSGTPHHDVPPHIVIPLRGIFKGGHGERCHLLPLANITTLVVNIQQVLNLLIAIQCDTNPPKVSWGFVGEEYENISFEEMNDFILEKIEIIKNYDVRDRKFELKYTDIREGFIINR